MNKPVAWLSPDNFFVCPEADYQVSITTEHPKDLGWIPLYTHPVKELTDEEIESALTPFVMAQFQLNKPSPQFDYLGFAKAILRKAQEK